jgi:uncharacterized protein (TIGR03435 family)
MCVEQEMMRTGWLAVFLMAATLPAIAADYSRFAVATIRPGRPEERLSVSLNGRRFSATAVSLKDLMCYAYMLHPQQISGGSPWVESDKFDVAAEADVDDRMTEGQARRMVQQLFADRFHLGIHGDRKELAIYQILLTDEPKLTKSAGDANNFGTFRFPTLGRMVVTNATMAEFANALQRDVLDRPVLDATGLPGRYDLALDWTTHESQYHGRGNQLPPPDRKAEPPDLVTAFRQQLGLRLVGGREPTPTLVIDRAEKPTDN